MPVMLKALALTLPEGGLLGTATMLGAMLGSILFGLISENRGRRFALVLALCWLDFPLIFGQAFPVETASLSILGREKESWAMLRWNS